MSERIGDIDETEIAKGAVINLDSLRGDESPQELAGAFVDWMMNELKKHVNKEQLLDASLHMGQMKDFYNNIFGTDFPRADFFGLVKQYFGTFNALMSFYEEFSESEADEGQDVNLLNSVALRKLFHAEANFNSSYLSLIAFDLKRSSEMEKMMIFPPLSIYINYGRDRIKRLFPHFVLLWNILLETYGVQNADILNIVLESEITDKRRVLVDDYIASVREGQLNNCKSIFYSCTERYL